MTADLVLAGGDVLVAPGDLRARHDVAIGAGRVLAVEPAPSSWREDAAATLDVAGLLAMPGLVNAHTHSPENPLRGKGDGLALEPWLARLFAESGPYTPDDHYACALAGAVEMLRGGTTAVIDHLWMTPPSPEAIDATLRALRDAGIRGAVAPLVVDADATVALAARLGVDVPTETLVPQAAPLMAADELVALTDAAMRRWHGTHGGRLSVLAGPSGVQWCSDELLVGLSAAARAHGSGLQIHLVETRLQDAACRERFGTSGLVALDELGVLGPETSLAHCVWIDGDDVGRIADRGAVVAHNPAANLRLRSGRAPVPALLAAGGARRGRHGRRRVERRPVDVDRHAPRRPRAPRARRVGQRAPGARDGHRRGRSRARGRGPRHARAPCAGRRRAR